MSRRFWLLAACVMCLVAAAALVYYQGSRHKSVEIIEQPLPELKPQERILVLAPHPDDEVLGCAGIIQQALARHDRVKVVFFTYGDNNEWSFLVYRKHPVIMPGSVQSMGRVRYGEALRACAALGVPAEDTLFLGYPDFRTLEIWNQHWGDRPPAESMLTRVNKVPYDSAYRPGAAYKAEEIIADLKAIIGGYKPTKIFVSHPADHNPDHKALYLFTRVALWDLDGQVQAQLFPYLIHFKRWPRPAGYFPDKPLVPPRFFAGKVLWQDFELHPEQVKEKLKAARSHRSQFISSGGYLASFVRTNELFSDFDEIVLARGESPEPLVRDRMDDLTVYPEQLLDQERVGFVGVESEYVSLQDGHLVYTMKLSRPLGRTVGFTLYAFGYSRTKPFPEMPKIQLRFSTWGYKVFDQDRLLDAKTVKVEKRFKKITVRIPLQQLGNPDRIFTSAHTYTLVVPLDWVSWRVLKVQ